MNAKNLWGFQLESWIGSSTKPGKGLSGQLLVAESAANLPGDVVKALPEWQQKQLKGTHKTVRANLDSGPVWLVVLSAQAELGHHYGLFRHSAYQRCRDEIGKLLPEICETKIENLTIQTFGLLDDHHLGLWVGLEMASYEFNREGRRRADLPVIKVDGPLAKTRDAAAAMAVSTNLARHFVNLPAFDLNPTSYAHAIEQLLSKGNSMKVDVWDKERLKKEKMNLLLAVGGAAEEGPCMVHVRYRPKGAKGKPVAFIGKGITFDTGGLDLKPSNAMRFMKKDMGGSATIAGLAYWVQATQQPLNCDFYFALAENAVSSKAFRPGDIYQARNGLRVEIDNTDAEGRLVLADAMDVAVKQKGDDAPRLLVDASTLTGAMRVAVGFDLIGMFANDDKLAEMLQESGADRGDLCWRLPLYEPYERKLKSDFADMANSENSGQGGAITAALFLQRFIGEVPWIHLDFNAYNMAANGACRISGGNGQGVQALARFVETLCQK